MTKTFAITEEDLARIERASITLADIVGLEVSNKVDRAIAEIDSVTMKIRRDDRERKRAMGVITQVFEGLTFG